MENPEYFSAPPEARMVRSAYGSLQRPKDRPPLPPKPSSCAVNKSTSSLIQPLVAERVNRFEKITAGSAAASSSSELWFYKDGLRTNTQSLHRPPKVSSLSPRRSKSVSASDMVCRARLGSTEVKSDFVSAVKRSNSLVGSLQRKKQPLEASPKPEIVRIRSSEIPVLKQPLLVVRDFSKATAVSKTQPPSPPVRPPRRSKSPSSPPRNLPPTPPPRSKSPSMKKNVSQANAIEALPGESEKTTTTQSSAHRDSDDSDFSDVHSEKSLRIAEKVFVNEVVPGPSENKEITDRLRTLDPEPGRSKEKMRLEEILELCADYERQIEEEQRRDANGDAAPGLALKHLSLSLDAKTQQKPAQPGVDMSLSYHGEAARDVMSSSYHGGDLRASASVTNDAGNASSHFVSTANVQVMMQSPVLVRAMTQLTTPAPHQQQYQQQQQQQQQSPSSTLTPKRIKTNGSLPRDKRHASPSPGSAPPSSPFLTAPESELNSVFNFDARYDPAPSAASPRAVSRQTHPQIDPASHYENLPPLVGSPRTRIRTTPPTPQDQSSSWLTEESGAGEDSYPTNKTKEELYAEAKDILSTIGGSPVARRPPRSKHDRDPTSPEPQLPLEEHFAPSQEATTRLLIGTTMLAHQQQQQQQQHSALGPRHNSIRSSQRRMLPTVPPKPVLHHVKQANSAHKEQLANSPSVDIPNLRLRREQHLMHISALKRDLTRLEQKEDEDIREIEMERSLLAGEWTAVDVELAKASKKLHVLRCRESQMSQALEHTRIEMNLRLDEARIKVRQAEEELKRLEHLHNSFSGSESNPDARTDLLEQLRRQHEVLDMERKIYEDIEFNQMEEEARRESEREDLLKEISDITHLMKAHEKQLMGIEGQQRKMLETVRKETKALENQRDALMRQMELERSKLSTIESQISNLAKLELPTSSRLPPLAVMDSDTDSDDESTLAQSRLGATSATGSEISRATTSKWAALDRSLEADLYRISVVEEPPPAQAAAASSPKESPRSLKDRFKEEVQQHFQQKKKKSSSSSSSSTGRGKASVGTSTDNPPAAAQSSNGTHVLDSVGGSEESVTESTSDFHTDSLSGDDSGSAGDNKTTPSPDSALNSGSSAQSGAEIKRRKSRGKAHSRSDGVLNKHHNESARGTVNINNNHNSKHVSGDTTQSAADMQLILNSSASASVISASRPLSEDSSSFWDSSAEASSVRMRTVNKRQQLQQRPLTRYLPVLQNEHFDLRAHVESAGHQIELCPHLVLNSSSCRGYLRKLGAHGSGLRMRGGWNKRWFVFDRHKKTLVYYGDKTENKVKGGVYFQSIEEVYVDHLNSVKSPNPKVTFCMKTADRTYYLMAPSPEAMRIWVDVIFTGAEGYQEFIASAGL